MINSFYSELLKINPYHYQSKVADTLLGEKNVILCVPTGAGKTWASVMPFLYAKKYNIENFPKKMIYSLPLRTLTNSIYLDVTENENIRKSFPNISRQTGEYAEDKFFEKDIIFSTIDQTLSNFLCFPLAHSQRQANINAGAIIGSYLVFDEFHLLEPSLSMGTTLGMLRLLGETCRCCIMTATLSDCFMQTLKDKLPNYEVVTLDDFPEDKKLIKSLLPNQDKKKIFILETVLTAEDIVSHHKDKTIVICNRVENTQKVYDDLIKMQAIAEDQIFKNAEIICLHSRFFDKDRKAKEDKLKGLFGKNTPDTNAILIATQVIEAGMDISCSVMHTEISPINSFLQRAGRCARFETETGDIFVYHILNTDEQITLDVPEDADKIEIQAINSKFLPYDKNLTIKTLLELKRYQTLDGIIPKTLIESVLAEFEKEITQELKDANFNREKILDSWRDCKKNNYRITIRDIQSVEIVLIQKDQKEEIEMYPFRYQSLGIYKWSLVSWLNKIAKGEGIKKYDPEEDVLAWSLEETTFLGETRKNEFENDEDVKYTLTKICDFSKIPSVVYLNAKFLGYTSGIGFNWQFEDTFCSISPRREWTGKDENFKPLTKDTFYQHNMGLIGAFEKEFLGGNEGRSDKLDFPFRVLANRIGKPDLTKDDFIKLIKLMIVLHDYGKLNNKWQKPMRTYQSKKEGKELASFTDILAHTDYDKFSTEDIALEKECRLSERGSHAGTGAYIAETIVDELFDSEDLAYAVSIAIARHHGAISTKHQSSVSASYDKFEISDQNYAAMQKLLNEFSFDVELGKKSDEGNLNGLETDEQRIIYLFLVRILRLCDQKATEDLPKYFNEA